MSKKLVGLLALLIVYTVATFVGILVFIGFEKLGVSIFPCILLADIIATIFVWLCGVFLKTASTYDPYWSIQTFIICLLLMIKFNPQSWTIGSILFLVCIGLYSVRLTTNFIIGFHSLSYVDWRYQMLKNKSGKYYQLVNLFGICMFPTLVVYSASLPAYAYVIEGSFSPLDIIGLSIIVLGTLLELVSDIQMKRFVKKRKDRSEVLENGLWKYSRHPNYLGEIAIWFGVALMLIIARPTRWYFIAGAVVNLLMFMFISIPMEEKHFKEYKPKYEEYKQKTHMLLILPKKK